jgi:hypothetical protein
MKRLLLVMMVVVGAVAGGAQISASASSTAPVKPLLSVTIPTGPELPLKQVEEIALTNAEQAGDAGPSMALGKGTLEDAMRSIDPTTTFPETETSNETSAEIHEMLNEPVTLVVMQGQFTLTNAHVRKGDPPPTGSVLDLVINSRTGAVMGRALPIQQEVLIQQEGITVARAASQGRIAVHSIMSMSPTGILDGRVLLTGGPARVHGPRSALRYTVLIKQGSRVVAKAITSTHGFRVRLRPGRYVVNGEQGVCKAQSVVVRSGKRANAILICSIR